MNKSILDGFRLGVLENALKVRQIRVYQEGAGCAGHDFVESRRENLYSGSKAFTALAIGLAEQEGRLSREDRLLDFFPEYRDIAAPHMDEVRLLDLLHMASGRDESDFDPQLLQTGEDYARLFIRSELRYPVGQVFSYSNQSTYMLGRVIFKTAGENLRSYLMPRLFKPLGIFNPQWETCPEGHNIAATGLYLTVDEYALLGRLLLQEGRFEERELVPACYVRDLHEDLISNANLQNEDIECTQGYGYQVWKGSHGQSYRADGLYGQFALVYPDERAAVTISAREQTDPYKLIHLVNEEILPRL